MSCRINLNGVYYTIRGDIKQTPINPWTAQIASGALEYSSFQKVNLEEWHDFRGGIGLESALQSESNRTWWCNGVDTTSARSAVLNPLVTTAGTFGVAPVKILDFMGLTYGIGSNTISRWNTGTSAWDAVTAASAVVIEDCEDAWNELVDGRITSTLETTIIKVGSGSAKLDQTGGLTAGDILATEVITSTDISSYTGIKLWIRCSKEFGTGEFQLLLDDTANCASPLETLDIPALTADEWVQVTIPLTDPASDTAIISIGIKTTVDIASYKNFNLYIDDIQAVGGGPMASPLDACVFKDETDKYLVVTSANTAMYSADGDVFTGLSGCRGFIAPFDNKLYSIDTDGSVVRASPVGNVDGTWTTFKLSEDIGTVHRLFPGKLLATGDPCLYISATNGLFALDVYTQRAYRQEVRYPPTTNAGRCGMYFDGNVWVGTGSGIKKITSNMTVAVGPNIDDGLPSGYQGDVYDMIGVDNWVVFCVNGGSTDKSSIFKRNTSIGGNLQVYTPTNVETLRPNAAGDECNISSQVGGSACPDHYDNVDEVEADDGTTYVRNTTWPTDWERDLYNMPNHIEGTGTINKVTLYFRCRSNASGNCVKGAIKSNSTVTETGEKDPYTDFGADTWGTYSEEYTTNPADSAAWAWADIDALQVGIALKRPGQYMTAGCTQIYAEVSYATNNPITCLHHSPSSIYTNGRLWWGEGTYIKYCMFPDTTSNVKQIATYQYVAASDAQGIILPKFRKLAAIKKVALSVSAVTKSCDANEYITLYYDINETGSWTSLGTYKTSPKPTMLTFPSTGGGLGEEFYLIQFAAKLQRGSPNTKSPELESLAFAWRGKPARISSWTMPIDCTGEDGNNIFDRLEAIYDTATLVVFYPSGDINKTSHKVAISRMPERAWWESMGRKEGFIEITVEELYKG